MDNTNFIIVEVRVCYSFSKYNIFSTKAIESFIVVSYCRRDPSRKPATRFFDSTFRNSLTFASNTKTMQMAREEVAKVSYCYYSQDSREIVWKFPCLEAAKFTDRGRTFWNVLPAAPRGRFRTLHPAKGYLTKFSVWCFSLCCCCSCLGQLKWWQLLAFPYYVQLCMCRLWWSSTFPALRCLLQTSSCRQGSASCFRIWWNWETMR